MKKKFLKVIALALVTFPFFQANAFVIPNSLFSDHAVLQRNVDVPVWGTARDGEKITVEFAGQKVKTVAANGKWMLKLKPLKAGGPFVMTITGDNSVTISDILVGEVWVCSGQSNMAMRMSSGLSGGQKDIDEANYPEIRQFFVKNSGSDTAVADAKSNWEVCSPATIKNFTAVGYFFARDLYKKLNIPFGLLSSSVGGTPAQNWISREALLAGPADFQSILTSHNNSKKTYPERLAKYQQEEASLWAKYRVDSAAASTKETKSALRKPMPPGDPAKAGSAGGLYQGMISPLQPYAIKGTIWYQGEANSSGAKLYKTLFPGLISSWRKAWAQGDFPFLFVQIAPHKGMSPEIREAQLMSWLNTPNTAMAVITDYGNAEDIHPRAKEPVGARLAIAARAVAYNEKIEYSGPVYKDMSVKDSKAMLSFTHAKELVAKGGELKGFMIAGADKKFVEAKAEIQGNKLVVYSPDVTTPVAVRYGWTNVPDINLYNEQDLPASPFRTDAD